MSLSQRIHTVCVLFVVVLLLCCCLFRFLRMAARWAATQWLL